MVSLELLRLMCDCSHIDVAKVMQLYEYWKYRNDLPFNARQILNVCFRPTEPAQQCVARTASAHCLRKASAS